MSNFTKQANSALGQDSVEFAIGLHDRALELWGWGEFEEAFTLASDARARIAAIDGQEHPDVANVTATLAGIRASQGQHAAARGLFEAALEGFEPWRDQESIEPLYIKALDDFGTLLRMEGRHAEAEGKFLKALELASKDHGPESFVIGGIRNNLGILYKYMARYDEAQAQYNAALIALKGAFERGETDATGLASLYHNFGGLAHARGDYVEAEAPARKALRLRQEVLGREHPDAVADASALASILEALGKNEEAESLFRRCLESFEGTYGTEHYEVAVTLSSLGLLLMDTGKLAEAERCMRRSLSLKEKLLGKAHPETALTAHNLGFLLARSGHAQEARTLIERSLRDLEMTFDAEHPHVVAARLHLSEI